MKMMNAQLELGLNGQQTTARPPTVGRRANRARWWFQQMHLVVERAFDWSSIPTSPPTQTYLHLARGH